MGWIVATLLDYLTTTRWQWRAKGILREKLRSEGLLGELEPISDYIARAAPLTVEGIGELQT